MDGVARPQTKILAPLGWIAVWGPGLLVMLADTDAGNVVTGAQAGAQWGYRLLPLLLLLIPMLYMVQELTVRLGRRHRARLRRIGPRALRRGMGVAGGGGPGGGDDRLAGHRIHRRRGHRRTLRPVARPDFTPRRSRLCSRSSPPVPTGGSSGRRSSSACSNSPSSPSPGRPIRTSQTLARDALDLPLGDHRFLYLAAAMIGAVFNPVDDLLPAVRHRR